MKKFHSLLALFVLACFGMLGAAETASRSQSQPVPMVSFKQSMSRNSELRASTVKTHPDWKLVESTYELFKKYGKNPHARYLIPRVIHIVNLQGQLSQKEHQRIDKLKKMHPAWEIKVWKKSDIEALTMRCKDRYEDASCLQEKIALASFEILYACGGLCMNPNFECVKAFDNLHQSAEFYTGLSSVTPNPELLPSLIGCTPHHPILEDCIISIRSSKTDATAAQLLTQSFLRSAQKMRGLAVALPVTFFNSMLSASAESVAPETYAFYHHCM